MNRFLLQMAGESGAGKSALARAIARETGAVVLDKDDFAGPLIDEGVLQDGAAGAAYAPADSILSQEHSLVLDSAALWPSIFQRGRELGRCHSVSYRVVQCICPDAAEQERRLAAPHRQSGQPRTRAELDASLARPAVLTELPESHLDVDTTQSISACVEAVLADLRRLH